MGLFHPHNDRSAGRKRVAKARRQKAVRQRGGHRAATALATESLEQRSMMAIDVVAGGPVSSYAIVASDAASDVYVRQDAFNNLEIADNSSFLANVNSWQISTAPDILFAVNGRAGEGPAGLVYWGDNRLPPAGPGIGQDANLSTSTIFPLSETNIQLPVYLRDGSNSWLPLPPTTNPRPFPSERFQTAYIIDGVLAFDSLNDGSPDVWEFEVNPVNARIETREVRRLPGYEEFRGDIRTGSDLITGLLDTSSLQVGDQLYIATLSAFPAGTIITQIVDATTIRVSNSATSSSTQPVIKFYVNAAGRAPVQPVGGAVFTGSATQRGYLEFLWSDSVPTSPEMTPPDNRPGLPNPPTVVEVGYSYGTSDPPEIRRELNRSPSAPQATSFQFDIYETKPGRPLGDETLGAVIPGSLTGSINGLGFSTDLGAAPPFFSLGSGGPLYFGSTTVGSFGTYQVTGSYSSTDQFVTLSFNFSDYPGVAQVGGVSFLRYVLDPNPNSFTSVAGHDITSQLRIGYLTTDSSININTNTIVAQPTNAASDIVDVTLAATNVNIRSQTASQDTFSVAAESLFVDAAVAAPLLFDLNIANDRDNDLRGGPRKGSLNLSPSGSISGALSPSLGSVTNPTAIINVVATESDVIAESIVFGTKQDWVMRSTESGSERAPFEFTTRSRRTGADTGLIRGGTVAILLGNDVPTPLDSSIAYNTLDLSTKIDSLRITAATRQLPGRPSDPSASGPFPYNLSVRENDDISIDAVAASGLPLAITSGGSMRFTAALATASDVTLVTQSTDLARPAFLTVSAPLSTTRGKIRLIGDGVTLNNSVITSGSEEDEYRDDIWITANAGDIAMSGLVAASNRIKIEQRSSLAPTTTPYTAQALGVIPDLGTLVAEVIVSDDFTFDQVEVNLTLFHTRPSDLRATLIAPDGRRFRLFDRLAVSVPPNSDQAFIGTIFDSASATSILQGTPPFTGRFSPLDPFTPLDGGSSLGTWRLEVTDAVSGSLPLFSTENPLGFLQTFGVAFVRAQGVNALARVSGAARVVADELLLDVQGSVGNPSQLPTDVDFYLRTDVNELSGTIGNSASFDELNDINIRQLRAGGLVSLRAQGVDPSTGANAGRPALRAKLVDITGLDVAAPQGSIDVFFDTSRTIEVGNAAGLRSGKSFNSLAAGDVKIRSNAGSLVVLDAPVAGGNARAARVASVGDLSTPQNSVTNTLVQYNPGNPGVTAGTLRGRGNLSQWFGVQIEPLRVGDRVLVKNQVKPESNGIYTLTFMSSANWTPTTTWTLARSTDADTSAELANNTFVLVGERQTGGIDQAGTWQITANYLPLSGATLTGISYAAGDTVLSVLNTSDLLLGMAVFGSGIAEGTTIAAIDPVSEEITLSQPTTSAGIAGETLRFVGATVQRQGTTTAFGLDDILLTDLATTSDLVVGMLVVGPGIPSGTTVTRILDGSTVVLSDSVTTSGTDLFSFITPFTTRTGNVAVDGTTVSGLTATGDLREGMLVVGPGIDANTTIQTIVNATTILLSPQLVPIAQTGVVFNFLAAMPTNFGLAPISVASRPVSTNIGSNDTSSTVSYVVSTNAGTNSSAGSLGKMMSLRQQNMAILGGDLANAALVTIANYAAASDLVTLDGSASLLAGMLVFGPGIPEGTLVTRIVDATTVQLSRKTTSAGVDAEVAFVQRQDTTFAFSAAVATTLTPIRLTQALPEITQPLTLDGSNLYAASNVSGQPSLPFIDGSRITLTQSNRPVRSGDTVSGLVVSGAGATGTTIRNLNLGGFARVSSTTSEPSAAIDVRDASGVLVSNVALGGSELGIRLGNAIGVRFTGEGTTSGTILNSDIFGSDDSGITVDNRASGVSVVGTTLGRLGMENKVGARFASGVNQFGVDTPTPAQQIPPVQATRIAANRFTLPASFQQQALRLRAGVRILGPTIVPSAVAGQTTIAAITTDPRTRLTTVTVAGGTVTGSGEVAFIPAVHPASIPEVLAFPRDAVSFTLPAGSRATAGLIYPGMALSGTTIQATSPTSPASVASIVTDPRTNITTITLAGGTITGNGRVAFGDVVPTTLNQRIVTLPVTTNFDNLFLGQRVFGTGIPSNTAITAINRQTRTLTLDKLFTRTGFTVLTFEAGSRNTVAQNRTGLVLAGGATTVTNSSISANPFNGIEITGSGITVSGQPRHHRIGTSFGPTAASNQIYGNGGWGVFFVSGVPNSVKQGVIVRGNYLGTTTVTLDATSLSNRKGNVGHFTNREEVFAGLASELSPRAIDGIDLRNNQHMVTRPPARPIPGQPWRRR